MLFRSINTILHFGCMTLLLLASPYEIDQLSIIGACMLACWAAIHLALSPKFAASAPQKTGLVIAITVLYFIGYLSKFGLALFIADDFWVVPTLIRSTELVSSLPQAYLITACGFISLLTGIFIVPSNRVLNTNLRNFRGNFWLATNALIIALLLKIYLKVTYRIAIPSVIPEEMGIPYLTGIMSLIIDTGMIFPATIPFVIGITQGKKMWVLIGFGVAMANAGIDLAFGAKDSMIYQLIIFGLILLGAQRGREQMSPDARRLLRMLVILICIGGVVAILVYPLANPYRYARLAGNDILTSMQIAWIRGPIDSGNPLMAIYNRITGIEVLTAVISIRNYFSGTTVMEGLFSTDLVSTITYVILGVEQKSTRFSITQIGYFYVAGGFPIVILGSFCVGIFFSLIQELTLRLEIEEVLKLTFLTVLWILTAKLMLGGGNLFLAVKELSVALAMFFAWGRFVSGGLFRGKRGSVIGNSNLRHRQASGWTK